MKLGLIGRSLTHSFSPAYFAQKFQEQGLSEFSYEAIELEPEEVLPFFKQCDLDGFNVTIPYKETVLTALHSLSPQAEEIGAVNCVKRIGKEWHGYNTDTIGFRVAITELIGNASIEQALVLGSGGASKAVQHALKGLGIHYKVVSRNGPITYDMLHPAELRASRLVINTTPLGMGVYFDQAPDVPYEAFSLAHFAVDLIYNPSQSPFLRKAGLLGASTMNGQRMLEVQADESWKIWTDQSD